MMKSLSLATVLAVLVLGTPLLAQSDGGGSAADQLRSTRDTLSRWVETQQIISKEKKEWQLGKEVLEQRISLIENEIATLEERTAETEKNITDADIKRQELLDENVELKAASTSLEGSIAQLEAKTLRLMGSLPRPILDRIEPLSQRIPRDPADTELSLSQRFQNVIGVLNEVNKFNRDITVTTELREMPNGITSEVQTIYFGLGQAYYVNAAGDSAGIGHPSADGWAWSEANHLAGRVTEAIAILKNEREPAYVPLPVEIR
jgi:hypothetical protein